MSLRSVALRDRLKTESSLQASEAIADASLDTWIGEAIAKHSPAHSADNLPTSEEEAVIVLAHVSLCFRRASENVNSPDTSGGNGIGAQRESVYSRNMRLAMSLQERYSRIVGDRSAEGSNSVVQGHLFKTSTRTGIAEGAPLADISLGLSSSNVSSTEVTLKLEAPFREDFCDFFLFYREGAVGNFEEWNHTGNSEIPRISVGSELLLETSDQNRKVFKIEDLSPATECYFIVVMWTNRDQYYYSNDLRVMTT